MPREYYACAFRYADRDEYLIWYSNDCDGVHLESDGRVPTFSSIDHLSSYARIHNLAPLTIADPVLHDLDSIDRFTRDISSHYVDCNETLNAWNLFGDLARSLGPSGSHFIDHDQAADGLYDKVLHGCKLPAMTPDGHEFQPMWSADEIRLIQGHLGVGISLFRTAVASCSQGIEEAERAGTGQPATRSQSKSEGGDKP
jgi:hypothetical protein